MPEGPNETPLSLAFASSKTPWQRKLASVETQEVRGMGWLALCCHLRVVPSLNVGPWVS